MARAMQAIRIMTVTMRKKIAKKTRKTSLKKTKLLKTR